MDKLMTWFEFTVSTVLISLIVFMNIAVVLAPFWLLTLLGVSTTQAGLITALLWIVWITVYNRILF